MGVELGALLAAASSVSALLKEVVPIAAGIRSGFRADNSKAREDLQARLVRLEAALKEVGALARVAQEYSTTLENVVELLALSQRAQRFLKENIDDLRERNGPTYQSGWHILDLLIESIDTARHAPRKAVLDRTTWFDADDRAKLDIFFHQFTAAFGKAVEDAKHRFADELSAALGQMIQSLLDAEAILRSTETRVLTSLQSLGQ